MSSLLPPNSTQFERAAESCIASAFSAVSTPAHTLWNADTCPESYLGYLAWAVGVNEWDAQWPEDTKRNAVRDAPLINLRRGTVWAVQRVLQNAGVYSVLREWFDPVSNQFSSTEPGTFDITVFISRSLTAGSDSREITPELIDRLRRMVDAAKPVGRHYIMRTAIGVEAHLPLSSAVTGSPVMLLSSEGPLQPYTVESRLPGMLAITSTPVQLSSSSGYLLH